MIYNYKVEVCVFFLLMFEGGVGERGREGGVLLNSFIKSSIHINLTKSVM